MPDFPDIACWRIPGEDARCITGEFKQVEEIDAASPGFVTVPFGLDNTHWQLQGEPHSIGEHLHVHLKNTEMNPVSRNEYFELCYKFIKACKSGVLQKAILSRVIATGIKPDPLHVFGVLCDSYPEAYVFLFSGGSIGTWIGASPEILLSGSQNRYSTMSLAGTRKIDSSEPWQAKEREEQEIVTRYIHQALVQAGALEIEQQPLQELQAGPVKHLLTKFNFKLNGSPSPLLRALHPTPAVCGLPKMQALSFIQQTESHLREFYSGYSGVTGPNLTLWVNLRCMQLSTQGACLYVGGGITKDSDPESEWLETEHKAQTLRMFL